MRSRVIGGEFELRTMPTVEPQNFDFYCYASGRTALFQILKSIKTDVSVVWLPDWLCESMIDAVKRSGLDYRFYLLDNNLQMNVNDFVENKVPLCDDGVIVLVNYFGLVDINNTIKELRDKKVRSLVIEDDVQSLFSFLYDYHDADFCFTSLRKSIASPDGGLVRSHSQMPEVYLPNSFAPYKLNGALMKGISGDEVDDSVYLRQFSLGEELIDQNYESVMSSEAAQIFADTDFLSAAKRRKENANFLINHLHNIGVDPVVPLSANQVPLFIPILINNRDYIRRELRSSGIFCPVHWPLRDDMLNLTMGRKMAEYELSLVVDQRYNLEDMQCIVDVLNNCLCR